MHVSIVRASPRRRSFETQRGHLLAALLFQCVNFRRVALQRHAFPQAVLEDNPQPCRAVRGFGVSRSTSEARVMPKVTASQRLPFLSGPWRRDLRPFFAKFLRHLAQLTRWLPGGAGK